MKYPLAYVSIALARACPAVFGQSVKYEFTGGSCRRCDGKHVDVQEWASACFLRGLVTRPSGTAV